MPKPTLTDRLVQTLRPRDKEYEIRQGDGFGVRVLPSGTRTFLSAYTSPTTGKRVTLGVGIYPKVTLAEARNLHRENVRMVEAGIDPKQAKGSARAEEIAAPTVEKLAAEYVQKWAKPRKRSWEEDERQLLRDVVPVWGGRKARDITRRDVRVLIEEKAQAAPIAANRLLACVRRMFNWAVEQDILEATPAARIKAPAKETRKERVLTPAELRTTWKAWEAAGATPEVRRALQLLLLTAQRPGEVAGAHWSEFSEGWWTIPGERAKNGQAHRVPLSPLARKVLGEPGKGYLFPSPTGNGPMNPLALTRACNRHARRTPAPYKSKSKGVRKRHKPPVTWGVDPFTPHDLRRTAASLMTGIGVPRLVVSKLLNHVERGVTAIYDRHSYDLEKREALDRWGTHLSKIVAGDTGKLVPLRRNRA